MCGGGEGWGGGGGGEGGSMLFVSFFFIGEGIICLLFVLFCFVLFMWQSFHPFCLLSLFCPFVFCFFLFFF